MLTAIFYYGSYLQYWFNPHDEGGTAAFNAMRLLEGELPLRDVKLNYNLLWFFPIVGLFKIFGVNFILMRGYFFSLSVITALCGWMLARHVTRREWIALAIGLALVIFPGSQFKNYIPLICVANTLCLVLTALATANAPERFWRRAAVGGLVLGFSLLIRIDIAYFFVVMWGGMLFLRLFDVRLKAKARFIDGLAAAAVICSGIVVTHLPVYAVARAKGFDQDFLEQYPRMAAKFAVELGLDRFQGQELPTNDGARRAGKNKVAKSFRAVAAPNVSKETKPRVTWNEFKSFQKADTSVLFLLTYMPLLALLGLVGWAAFGTIAALFGGRFTMDYPSMLGLLLLGGALTTFPQFFFFRPDRPHLSEFMPGFIVASTCAVVLMKRGPGRWLLSTYLVVILGLFGWFAMDHYSAGTIAARTTIKRNKRVLFHGANGVNVYVHQREFEELEGVRRAIVENSKAGEWVVCYPYQPGYNVMTDRPTYERDLYIDNAESGRNWNGQTISRIEKKQPAVVVIDDRAINKIEDSRFSRWAQPVYDFVRTHYHHAGTFDTVEVYARDPVAEGETPPP